jgi:hypothetical protein
VSRRTDTPEGGGYTMQRGESSEAPKREEDLDRRFEGHMAGDPEIR